MQNIYIIVHIIVECQSCPNQLLGNNGWTANGTQLLQANWTFPTSTDHLSACPTSTDPQKSAGWTNPFEKYSSFYGNLPQAEVNNLKNKTTTLPFCKNKVVVLSVTKIQEPPNPRFSCSGQLFCLLLFLLRETLVPNFPAEDVRYLWNLHKWTSKKPFHIETKTRRSLQIIHPLPKNLTWNYCNHTVDAKNPAPVEVGSLSHDLQGFVHPNGGWEWDFWTIMPVGSNWANCHKINQLTGTYRAASWKNLAAKMRLLHPPAGGWFGLKVTCFFHAIEMLGKYQLFSDSHTKTIVFFIILWFLRSSRLLMNKHKFFGHVSKTSISLKKILNGFQWAERLEGCFLFVGFLLILGMKMLGYP